MKNLSTVFLLPTLFVFLGLLGILPAAADANVAYTVFNPAAPLFSFVLFV